MKTVIASSSVASVKNNELDSIANQISNLQKHLESLRNAQENMVNEKVRNLPSYLNVTNIEEAFILVKNARNQLKHQQALEMVKTVGNEVVFPKVKGKQGRTLDPEVVQGILHLIKHSNLTIDEIALKTNVSRSAIHRYKSIAGLVKHHTPKAVA